MKKSRKEIYLANLITCTIIPLQSIWPFIQIPNKGRGLFVDQLKSTILEKKWIFEFLLKYVTWSHEGFLFA